MVALRVGVASSPIALTTTFLLHLLRVFVNVAVLRKIPGDTELKTVAAEFLGCVSCPSNVPRKPIFSSYVAFGDCYMITIILLV